MYDPERAKYGSGMRDTPPRAGWPEVVGGAAGARIGPSLHQTVIPPTGIRTPPLRSETGLIYLTESDACFERGDHCVLAQYVAGASAVVSGCENQRRVVTVDDHDRRESLAFGEPREFFGYRRVRSGQWL